jgi:hypothetical protein
MQFRRLRKGKRGGVIVERSIGHIIVIRSGGFFGTSVF